LQNIRILKINALPLYHNQTNNYSQSKQLSIMSTFTNKNGLSRLEVAKALGEIKREAGLKVNFLKSLNYKTVVKTLEGLGVEISVKEYQSVIETGKSAAGNPFKRTVKNGFEIEFNLGGERFWGLTTNNTFSYSLTSFVSCINIIVCAKELTR